MKICNFKIYKPICNSTNGGDSIILTNQIKISKTTFPEERIPIESLSNGSKSITWIQSINYVYKSINLLFFLEEPENNSGAFSFPTNNITVRVVADPPGESGGILNIGALLASQTFNTPGFKVMNVLLPKSNTVLYVGYTENVSDMLLSTEKPRIFGMKMEFHI